MNEELKSRVDRMDENLYSRKRYKSPEGARSPVRETEEVEVNSKWQSPELNEILMRDRISSEVTPFMKKFFIFAMCFFGAAIFIAGFIFLGGSNFVSSKNVDIEVVGPASVSAGEVIELGVTVENHNNTDLEAVKFSVQYPAGARDAEDSARTLTFEKTNMEDIDAGDEAVKNVRMVLIGTTGEVKQVKFSVEYRVKGSNATFYKDKLYDITIGEAPMTLSIESPPSVGSGDTFTIKAKLALNSSEILKNVMLRAEYPYGFSVVSATPQPISENNVWALGDFSPGTEKTIEIKGKLVGENQDERTVRFYAGVSDNGSLSKDFKSVIVSSQQTISIERPSIGLGVSFNGEQAPIYVAPAGRGISTAVRFQNNLPERIVNPKLEVILSGAALDRASVQSYTDGVYNPNSSRITWNITNSYGDYELLPGQNGTVNFSFSSLPEGAIPSGNKDINLEFRLSGIPVGSGNQPVTITETRTVKIGSQITLNSKALFSIGPFKNSGPIPPKVGSDTTYTIVWTLGNTLSDITDARVTAKLGNGVKYLNAHSLTGEDVEYNEEAGTISWELGNLSSGSGFSTASREVALQLVLTPMLSQAGTAPVLLSGITFIGLDQESGNETKVTNSPVTTKLSQDPAFIQGDDIVVR